MGMLGLAPLPDGTKGLSPAEHQVILRSMYAADGILSGCEVLGSSSDLSVTVKPGAVVLPTSGTGAVVGPTPETRLVFDPAPATGEDVYDILVSCKNEPGASPVIRLVKNAPPAVGDKRIERWHIPAGATNAAAGRAERLKDYAIPVGAGTSHLVDHYDRAAYGTLARRTPYRNYTATFYLGQDRHVDIRLTQSFSAQPGGPAGSVQYVVRDSISGLLTTPILRYDERPATGPAIGATSQITHRTLLNAGWHTITVDRQQISGGQPVHVGGQAPQSDGLVWRPWNRFEVVDNGIAY